jgi:hypothetical protein
MRKQQFADMHWETRWNDSEQAAALSQNGHEVMLVTSMGVVYFDLRQLESINTFIGQMEVALQMLAKAKVQYDQTWGKK